MAEIKPYYQERGIILYHGDCLDVLRAMDSNTVDAIVTDPPYALTGLSRNGSPRQNDPSTPFGRTRLGSAKAGFMGKTWDADLPGVDVWAEALRVIKPGGHFLAFGGTRTYHRLARLIEDAGWEVRDCLMWLYGSGFPKSLDVSKAIDKAAGAKREVIGRKAGGGVVSSRRTGWDRPWKADPAARERAFEVTAPATEAATQWAGWGTALKPAYEPILLARKPLDGTVAENVVRWGTGALNIEACRIPVTDDAYARNCSGDRGHDTNRTRKMDFGMTAGKAADGRWPANVIHDGSEEVIGHFPDQVSGANPTRRGAPKFRNTYGTFAGQEACVQARGAEEGSAARFFYTAKATPAERTTPTGDDNTHPTVKPMALITYLLKLVVPPGGTVLDPFVGSGTLLVAARALGIGAIGIERENEYCEIAVKRLAQGVLPL